MDSFANTHRLDKQLVNDCLSLMAEEGSHLAIIGPDRGGKSLLLRELEKTAKDLPPQERPKITRLFGRELSTLPAARWELAVAEQLGIPLQAAPETQVSLSERLYNLFLEACKDPQPLWLFFEDVVDLPVPFARQLLWAFQRCNADGQLKGHLGVAVTGSSDFIPLTFTSNSPYHHAKRILLTGLGEDLGREFCEQRMRLHGHADQDPGYIIAEQGFHQLLETTGGSPHLMQEAIAGAFQFSRWQVQNLPPAQWGREYTTRLTEHFLVDQMPTDHLCQSTLDNLFARPELFDIVLAAIEAPTGIAQGSDEQLHQLEAMGLMTRLPEQTTRARISCSLWNEHLRQVLTQRARADVFGLQGRWERAWPIYRQLSAEERDRACSGQDARRLLTVVHAWSSGLMRLAFSNVQEVAAQFALGAHYLLGIDSLAIYDARDGEASEPLMDVSEQIKVCPRFVPSEQSFDDLINKTVAVKVIAGETPRLWSRDQGVSLRNQDGAEPMICMAREDPAREFVETDRPSIDEALLSFWQALIYASDVDYRRRMGQLHEAHLEVVSEIVRKLTEPEADIGEVIQATVELLTQRDSSPYARVQVCLIDPTERSIQKTFSMANPRSSLKPLEFDTNYELPDKGKALTQEEANNLDVQQWVVYHRKSCVIANAGDPNQYNPKTQTELCRQAGMKALAVVPIKSGGKVLGTLHLERSSDSVPPEDEVRVYETLAKRLGDVYVQAQRRSLLEQSLRGLRDEVRVYCPKGSLVYTNDPSSYQVENTNGHAWRDAILLPTVEAEQQPVRAFYPKEKPLRATASPIFDFRAGELVPERSQGDGRVGFIEQVQDYSEIARVYESIGTLLRFDGLPQICKATLDLFRQQNLSWLRIYLFDRANEKDFIYSFMEYGLVEANNQEAFRNGEIRYTRGEDTPEVWGAIDRRAPIVLIPEGIDSEVARLIGLHPHRTTGLLDAQRLERKHEAWIEAPLWVGQRLIGLLSFPVPDWRDDRWVLLNHTLQGIAFALARAQEAERRQFFEKQEREFEKARKIRENAERWAERTNNAHAQVHELFEAAIHDDAMLAELHDLHDFLVQIRDEARQLGE